MREIFGLERRLRETSQGRGGNRFALLVQLILSDFDDIVVVFVDCDNLLPWLVLQNFPVELLAVLDVGGLRGLFSDYILDLVLRFAREVDLLALHIEDVEEHWNRSANRRSA